MYPQAIAEFQKGVKLSGSPLVLALWVMLRRVGEN